jgi:hypothetical protein
LAILLAASGFSVITNAYFSISNLPFLLSNSYASYK